MEEEPGSCESCLTRLLLSFDPLRFGLFSLGTGKSLKLEEAKVRGELVECFPLPNTSPTYPFPYFHNKPLSIIFMDCNAYCVLFLTELKAETKNK